MTVRRKLVAYLLFIHIVFAAPVVYFLWDYRIWLLAVEAILAVSLIAALKIFQRLFRPLDLIASGVEFLRDGDFATRLRESGQREMDLLIGVYNDMVDRLRSERIRTQEQHQFLEKILNVSPSAIVTLDYDSKIVFANPAAESLLQISREAMIGTRLDNLGTPFAKELSGLPMGRWEILPFRGIRKIRCHKSSYIDRGHPRTFFLLEELTEELRRTEKGAYEKLIRLMSHEVNNSLGAATSLLQSCLRYAGQLREEDRSDFETAIAVALERMEHLGSFTKSFADIVKLPMPRLQPVDILALLRNVALFLSHSFSERNIGLVWDIRCEPGRIRMDERQMEQVFLNILKNSMEAIGSGGKVTISAGRNGRRDFVCIEDTGSGIGEETARHLFTPFFSTKENGQGIGLTLVQEILTHHNFEFFLESTAGQSTRFTILF